MPNSNAFEVVVHEKIFKDLSKFPLFCPLNGLDPWFEQIGIPIA